MQTTFPDRAVMAELLAKMLWEIKAVHFNAETPYKFASGMASPVYIDCRKLLSYPRVRSTVMDFAASVLLRDAGFEQFDCIAGGETAGIPFAALLADRLGLPMIYVRKKPKGHGRNAQIEGDMPAGARVLVIEDLTTAGGSMFTFIDAIRAAGGIVDHAIALFTTAFLTKERCGLPTARCASIISPHGATCLPSPRRRSFSTTRRCPPSRRFSMHRSPGQARTAASPSFRRRDALHFFEIALTVFDSVQDRDTLSGRPE